MSKNNNNENNDRRPGRPSLIDEELFMQVWEAADSLDEVVETFFPGDPDVKGRRLYCSMRASTLRREGQELKLFPRGRKANSIVNVDEIINEDEDTSSESSEQRAAE